MSSYSVPKRLLHIIFGGSAIWFGTAFCSPLEATDLGLPPRPASAPDALASPDSPSTTSIVPPASWDEVSHWDNGSILEDEVYNNDNDLCQEEYCNDYEEYEFAYECADLEETYTDDLAEEQAAEPNQVDRDEDAYCYEDYYYDEYPYDGYDSEVVLNDEETPASTDENADGLVDIPEDSTYSDIEDSYGSSYGYYSSYSDDDEMYAHDEYMGTDDNSDSSEDYAYDYDDESGYEDDWSTDYEMEPAEDEDETVQDVTAEAYADDEEHYRDYWYDDEYVSVYGSDDEEEEMISSEDRSQDAELAVVNDTEEAEAEEDFSYEFDDYELYYGYDDIEEVLDDTVPTESESADDVAETTESNWEDYYYGDEYQYYSEEYENDSIAEDTSNSESVVSEATAEEAWADEYDYYNDGYYDYEMSDTDETTAIADEPTETWDEIYDDYDPMEQYEYEYEASTGGQTENPEDLPENGLDLFTWRATELLQEKDCDLIRSIDRLATGHASDRRACLNDYIETLGFEAIDFAYRYEDTTDSDVLALADDLPGTAAFLAAYRLIENRKIAIDDAVVLLESALAGLSLDWIEDVGRISASDHVASASHPVVVALATAANRSIASLGAATEVISAQIESLPWAELEGRLHEIRAAFRPLGSGDSATF